VRDSFDIQTDVRVNRDRRSRASVQIEISKNQTQKIYKKKNNKNNEKLPQITRITTK